METVVNRVTELLTQMNKLSDRFNDVNSETIQELYTEFGEVVNMICQEDVNRWDSLRTGYFHIGDAHIDILSDRKSAKSRKLDAYKFAHEELSIDIKDVFDAVATKN